MSILYFDAETTSTGDDGLPVDVVLAVTRVDGTDTVWREHPFRKFTSKTAIQLATALVNHEGTVCTFNGASFDFKILAALLPLDCTALREKLVHLCFHRHIDIFFDFFTSMGYFASLESFCAGSGVGGKSWSGAESAAAVSHALAAGTKEETSRVARRLAEYCTQDVVCLEALVNFLAANSCLYRQAKSKRVSAWVPWEVTRFRPVAACILAWNAHPVVVDWMESPPASPLDLVAWSVRP